MTHNFPGSARAATSAPRKMKPGFKTVGDHTIFQRDQPHGEDGVRYSLNKVAEKIAEGRLHPMVRAWTMKTLAKVGNPKGPKKRAAAILEAIRTVEGFPKATRWVPDPTASEYIAGAHLTLGDGDKPPVFALGDCDDLTVAFGSAVLVPIMYLAAAESVGAVAAVVGHAYDKDKLIVHVLGAVYDEGRWWYADPSVKDLPFGECKPFTRERVYLVPSMELLCDATVCLTGRGPAAGPPPPPRRGDFVSVDALPGQDVDDDFDAGPTTLMGFCDLSGCCGEDEIRRPDADDAFQQVQERIQDQERLGVPVMLPPQPPTQRDLDQRAMEAQAQALRARANASAAWADASQRALQRQKQQNAADAAQIQKTQGDIADAIAQQAACEQQCMQAAGLAGCCGEDSLDPRDPLSRPGPTQAQLDADARTSAAQAVRARADAVAARYADTTASDQAIIDARAQAASDAAVEAAQRAANAPSMGPSQAQLNHYARETAADAARALAVADAARADSKSAAEQAIVNAKAQAAADAADQAAAQMAQMNQALAQQLECKKLCKHKNPYADALAANHAAQSAAAGHEQTFFSDAEEAHQAARIKAQILENQSDFQAWADAPSPCSQNPLTWNIINVPPQTDYAAQELYQPWYDGLEPTSGASWEIRDSAFLQPRKDV